MATEIEVRIPEPLFNEEAAQELASFFTPFGNPLVYKQPSRDTSATKSWEWNPIEIVVTIVGAWATERFILNPLADRVEDWWKGITAYWTTSKSKPPMNVLIKFNTTGQSIEISFDDTRNETELRQAWKYIKLAGDHRDRLLKDSITLDAIRIIPTGTGNMLAVGYTGRRPTHIIDLDTGTVKPIPDEGMDDKIGPQLWMLSVLLRARDYLIAIGEMGYQVPDGKLQAEETAIEDAKRALGS